MNVTFKQLRTFLTLAEQESITAASRALHVTQPTVSMQLKEITDSVGMPLYEVTGKKLQLTEAGRDLEATARAMLHEWDLFEQGIAAKRGLTAGRLRLAVVSTAKYFMPRLIGSFCNRHPAIDVSLEILNRDGVVQRLRDNLDDLYIMSMPPAEMDLADQSFLPNPIVVIVASDDALARRRKVTLQDLAERRFILRESGSGTRMAADQFFRAEKFRPNIRLELGSNEAVKESVAGGLGIGVVSRHALHGHQKEHGVSVINVAGFPLPSAWHIVHPASKRLSPLAAAFKQHVLSSIADY
eukprot:gene19277-19158_t